MQAGAGGRVDPNDPEFKKQYPFDFALWKAAKLGEPAWDSPWGQGRPGWHIECSAMIRARLGETIDIHGGGGDLVFPHHENEIAQSEVLTGQPLANYWLHNGMVTVNGEKMSKSLGNFTTIQTLLDQPIDPMAIRLFVLQAHYRKPLDFTQEAIASAGQSWNTLKAGLLFGNKYGEQLGWNSETIKAWNLSFLEQFQVAMDDDFNTPSALGVVFELAKQLRREGNRLAHDGSTQMPTDQLWQNWITLVHLSDVLGLRAEQSDHSMNSNMTLSIEAIETFIQQRQEARKTRNFAESDRIRNELQAVGITLIDQPDGQTRWHRS
jgi:cysteinyl-tRNA synthetase